MAFRNPPKTNRADLKAQAEAALAAFREKGGEVKQMPPMVARTFSCSLCGHTAVIGAREGQRVRCPKCREMMS